MILVSAKSFHKGVSFGAGASFLVATQLVSTEEAGFTSFQFKVDQNLIDYKVVLLLKC